MKYVWIIADHQLCGVYDSLAKAEEQFRGYGPHLMKRINEELTEVYRSDSPFPRYTISKHEVKS